MIQTEFLDEIIVGKYNLLWLKLTAGSTGEEPACHISTRFALYELLFQTIKLSAHIKHSSKKVMREKTVFYTI